MYTNVSNQQATDYKINLEVKNSFLNSTKNPKSTMEESYCKVLHEMLPVADNPSCVLSVHFILRN